MLRYPWAWDEATNDEVTQVKTTNRNHCGGVKRDGNTYWYDQDGLAVLRWNRDTQQNELRRATDY